MTRNRPVRAPWRAAVLIVLACAAVASAQNRIAPWPQPGTYRPTVEERSTLPADIVQQVRQPALDLNAILAEDDKLAEEGGAPRYAIPRPVRLSPRTDGLWEQLDADTLLWRLRITVEDAVSINLGFSRFVMPEGGRLMLYSFDMRHVLRPYTHEDNADHGELWTPPVAGGDLMIEVTVPASLATLLELELTSVNVGYRPFMIPPELQDLGAPRSGACNVDVMCPQGDPWRDQIQAVGVISTGGSRFCTGFMVNNTSNNLVPYFMTANHCGINSGNAASLVVFWNYQNSFCRPPGSQASGQPGDGSLSQNQSGSTFRAAASVSDFTLVQLTANPNPAWNVGFAGWDRQDRFPPSGSCIHHPNTDEKRITLYDIAVRPDRPTHGSSWGCSPFPGPGDGTHIKVYWSLAVTEPGSSGSPLFDEFKRVIGQLHGGASACGQTGDNLSDCYGRIWRSWTGNGTAATRLSDWLDATNTGALNTDTLLSGGLSVSPTIGTTHIGIVGGPFTNNPTNYAINNQTANAANYSVSIVGGGTAPLLLNGGPGPLNGTVPAGGPSAGVAVSLDASANSLPAGIYTTTVRFQDTTNNLTMDRIHTLEVGQTGFNTTPANGLSAGGPVGGPFTATQVYTLTSTQPTPVTIQIAANQPWISINGGAGPVNINLNGTGDNTAVTIGYSAAANSLAAGLYNGQVSFTNLSGGNNGNTTRAVQLDVGRYTYTATDVPQNINDNSTITSVVNVTDAYCIGDVNVQVDITHTYIGDLIVEVISPAGTIVRLHNRTGGSADDIHRLYDDGVTNPDGPGALADFIGENVQGNWTLRVSDNAGQDVGTLDGWQLKIAAGGGSCAPPQLVYSWPLDTNPGWSADAGPGGSGPNGNGWAWGVPNNSGGTCGTGRLNPTSGFTGSNVYGYNLIGCYTNSLSPTRWLTTTAIDCTGLSNVKLKFRRWLGIESATYDKAYIEMSTNGTSWTPVWTHAGGSFSEQAWTQQTYNLIGADNQPTVYLRWGIGPTDSSVTYQGWNIDDIEIWAIVPDTCVGVTVGDVNDDGDVNGGDIAGFTATVLNPGGATQHALCASDASGGGGVTLDDVQPFVDILLAP